MYVVVKAKTMRIAPKGNICIQIHKYKRGKLVTFIDRACATENYICTYITNVKLRGCVIEMCNV